MKKLKIAIIMTLIISLFIPMCMFYTSAQEISNGVDIRIESYDENIYYNRVAIEKDVVTTLAELLQKISQEDENLTIIGIETAYISEINGIAGGKFGGWDGWLYMVNGESPDVGIDAYELKVDDVVVFYYSDAFGEAGMQYPTIDDSKFEEDGILKFTSADTVYDENYTPTTTINPVVGAVVSWGYDTDKTAEYTTDENGEIVIPLEQRTYGLHSLQINRYVENGLATVLRFAPDFAYMVTTETAITTNNTETPPADNVKTIIIIATSALSLCVIIAVIVIVKRKKII